MRIPASPQGNTPRPSDPARAAYRQAKVKEESLVEPYQDKIDTLDSWQRLSFATGLAGAVGTGYYLHTVLQADAQAGGYLSAIAGFAVGAATFFAIKGATHLQMENSGLLPDLREARTQLVDSRETYRQALLDEMGDAGVVDQTQADWDQLKAWEAASGVTGGQSAKELAVELAELEFLADSRHSSGWLKELATLEDDPHEFRQQTEFVGQNEHLESLLERLPTP